MSADPLTILQVNTRDVGGGAEKVAWDLFQLYRAQDHRSYLAVGFKKSDNPDVVCIPNDAAAGPLGRLCWRLHQRLQPDYGRSALARFLCRTAHRMAQPGAMFDRWRGWEDFRFPGTHRLAAAQSHPPDVIHAHNLHGGYFDLRAIADLSRRTPTIVSMHDAWLTTGHCAHSLDCDRWMTGCGVCPHLDVYPRVRRDATAFNWRRKQRIYAGCRLHVATPCQWLMDKVRSSMLRPAIADARVIPYGIDLSVFLPADKGEARRPLGLPPDAHVLLFAASGVRANPWKDYATMREAVARVGHTCRDKPVLFVALGEDAPSERVGQTEIRFIPFSSNAADVARWYQAADLYVHAARVDTFPCTVLEALACGTPVVATAVGGIPEQVNSLAIEGVPSRLRPQDSGDLSEATGILTPPGDAEALSRAIAHLCWSIHRSAIGLAYNAEHDAHRRFDLNRHADQYLAWYAELAGRDLRTSASTQTPRTLAESMA